MAILTVLFVTTIPLAQASRNPDPSTYLDPLLEAKAHTTPNALVNVIIQSNGGTSDAENAYQSAGNGDSYGSGESMLEPHKGAWAAFQYLVRERLLEDGVEVTPEGRLKRPRSRRGGAGR